MSAAATKIYSPVITEANPKTANQQRLYAEGYRGFWVEASGKTVRKHIRIVAYLLTVMPDGYIKCPCLSAHFNHGKCCHKDALQAHLLHEQIKQPFGSPRTTNIIAAKPVPQMTFACKREAALLNTDHSYAGSIFKAAS